MVDELTEDLLTPRSKVRVVTRHREFVGFLHTLSADRRESDVLNDDKTFLHMTDVEVRIKGGMHKNVPFVAVHKASIICVIPEDVFQEDDEDLKLAMEIES
jgi:hypothetical protein